MTDAGLDVRDIGALFFTSVTGISSPSIDALLINRMGLSPNIRRIPMFGLGCVAGAAGIARAADYVRAYPDQIAVILAVELCSLTLQREDMSMANLISRDYWRRCGRGCGRRQRVWFERGPKILDTRSVFYPQTERMMGGRYRKKAFESSSLQRSPT